MLLCFTAFIAVYAVSNDAQPNDAEPITWSQSEAKAFLWDTALSICPNEASLLEQEFPEIPQRTLDRIIDPDSSSPLTDQDPDMDSLALRPRHSPEFIHYVLFIIFSKDQVNASLALQQEYMDHVLDPENSPVTLRQQTQILTDFAKCLVPAGLVHVSSPPRKLA